MLQAHSEKFFLPIFHKHTYIPKFRDSGICVWFKLGIVYLYIIKFWESFSQAIQEVGWEEILKQDKTRGNRHKIVKPSKIT